MNHRHLVLGATLLMTTPLFAQAPAQNPAQKPAAVAPAAHNASASSEIDGVVLSNQMMITIMERMKAHNFPEARSVALQMIEGADRYVDTLEREYRSFSSAMGKKLYEMQAKRDGRNIVAAWVQQPIADGYYFLAMIDFQEGKPREALENLQKAIGWDPVRAAFHVERGFIQLQQPDGGDLALTMASYLKGAELSDNAEDFAAAMRGIGYVLVEKDELEAAMAAYIVARRFDPAKPAAQKEIDFIKSQNPAIGKDLDEAKAASLLQQKSFPSTIGKIHSEVLIALAGELDPAKNGRQIKALLKRALTIDPGNTELQQRLATLK